MTFLAFSGESMSPLANTGIDTACLIAAMVSYSASPVYRSARVRPCTARAWIPACSASFATVTPLRLSRSQPVRIFRVTGTSTALTTASRISATSASSRSRADPAALLHTFFAGQPMLMSMICAPSSTFALRGLGQHGRIAAGDLHRARLVLAIVDQAQARLAAVPQADVAGHHLRYHHPGAKATAKLTERTIGHPGHRREDQSVGQCIWADAYHRHGASLSCGAAKKGGHDTRSG